MLTTTAGIILHTIKHSDKSTIVTIYTREFGRVSFAVYGLSGKRRAIKTAFLLPLSIVEISTLHHPGKEIQQLKDLRMDYPLTELMVNPVKNAIALFLSELLYKILRQPDTDERLFDFLKQAIQLLNESSDGLANFHLIFMLKLSKYLGFEPNKEKSGSVCFDLLNGVFLESIPAHKHVLQPESTLVLSQLLHTDFLDMATIRLSRAKKNDLLDGLIEYYRLHMPGFQGLNSVSVLHELFN